MKKRLLCIVLLLCAFQLPASAEGLKENEIINISVVVNNDNSIELIASTTDMTLGPNRYFCVYAENDIPEQTTHAILFLNTLAQARQTSHISWAGGEAPWPNERFYEYTDENGMLKPGRYFAVVQDEWGYILSDRAYFTIPAIEQWWTPQPTQAPSPTPTEEPTPDATAKPTPKKTATPIRTASPAPKASSGIGTIHIAAYVILGVIICAELVVICYLAKKKK